MPDFAHPWLLLLLALAPLAAWAWLRRRRAALRYSDVRLVADLPALVVALAGPRWPDPGTRLPAEGIAVVVALDVSGSMAEPDFDWHGERLTRLEAAKRALRLFVRGGDAAGTHLPGRGGDQV